MKMIISLPQRSFTASVSWIRSGVRFPPITPKQFRPLIFANPVTFTVEFSVSLIKPVQWNTSAFPNLVIPPGRKDLLKSLIETHHKQLNFDDFIKGKGHGLVINLFGPPGVGKTFSAEATSEHVQKPLYVVGAGDLGTNATALETALSKVFELATAWGAIVLIDEVCNILL